MSIQSLMAYKPTLEEIVRKLLDNATFFGSAIELDQYEDTFVDGEEIVAQLRAALHEIELQELLHYDDRN